MGIFDRFPYSSTHEMNLDYMLGKATEIAEDMQTVTTGMAQVQAGLSAISEKTEQATQAAAQAAQSASSIEGSVTAAEEAAEEAQMHNESAQTWANNAMTYKADCQRAATEAAASSSSAAQAATAAAASEDTVATYAQAANASAQSAANNNDSAHQYANQASASASNATFHSSNAQTAATNAQTAATNAQTAATRTEALKDDCETLHRMCTAAVDQAATEAVNAANSAAQAAAAKTDVETLVESLPEDFTDLNNTVNQLSDEKVNKPVNSPNGTSGQLLRTNGDGTTTWVDQGLPTDAQTATAVAAWLNDHPEATTTVQDNSLTESKFSNELKLKTVKEYITPQMFGAKGDGVTDDTQAINDALAYINQKGGGVLYCPKGVYIFTSWMRFGRNTAIIGDGIGITIFKFPDNSDLTKCYLYTSSGNVDLYMIGFVGMGGVDTNYVRFENIEIDLNCSNNRHWITNYPNFDGWMNGINLASEPTVSELGGTPIPPKVAYINNVYIHDAERNCILTNINGDAYITNSIFENSDTDHLIYGQVQAGHKITIDNCIFKGYARESLLQLSGATITNCKFYDLKNNPTDFSWNIIVSTINRSGQETGISINNCHVDIDFNNNSEMNNFTFAIVKNSGSITNININVKNADMQNANFGTECVAYLDACTELIMSNINVNGAGKKFSILFAKNAVPDNSIIVSNVHVEKGTIDVYGGDSALIYALATTDINGAIFDNVSISKCVRVIGLANPVNLKNIMVVNCYFGNSDTGYFIDGTTNENVDIVFNNVTLASLRANSDRSTYGMKYVNSYYLNNGARTPIANTYNYV